MTDDPGHPDNGQRGNKVVLLLVAAFLIGVLGYTVWEQRAARQDAGAPDNQPATMANSAGAADAPQTASGETPGATATETPVVAETAEPGITEQAEAPSAEPQPVAETGEEAAPASEALATVETPAVDSGDAEATVLDSAEVDAADTPAAETPVQETAEAEAADTPVAEAPVQETAEVQPVATATTEAPVEETAEAQPASAEAQSAETTVAEGQPTEAPAKVTAEAETAPDAAATEETEVAAVTSSGAGRDLGLRPPETVGQNAPNAPRFDIVRIDETGAGLVAGRAEPGSIVRVMSGSIEIATAEVQASGEFVAFIQTPDNDEGQVLSLVALSGTGTERGAEDLLVLPVENADATPVAPAIVAQGNDGARLIQPSGLGKVDGVTLDSINYDETGAVRLSGRAPGALPIRIYVDGKDSGAAAAAEDGTWTTVIDGIAAGRYVLRIDALNTDGSVSSRAESPFQRVFPTAEQRANPTQITVQPGNTLWVMARERYGQGILYTQIYAANQTSIRNPDLIFPGQIFTIPEEDDFIR